MTYNEFERKLYNCRTPLDVVRLCVDNNQLAKKFVEKQVWLKHLEYEHVFKGMNETDEP